MEIAFVICIHNEACDDLEHLKIYKMLPDESATKESDIRWRRLFVSRKLFLLKTRTSSNY
jgi:hypothetical protein